MTGRNQKRKREAKDRQTEYKLVIQLKWDQSPDHQKAEVSVNQPTATHVLTSLDK